MAACGPRQAAPPSQKQHSPRHAICFHGGRACGRVGRLLPSLSGAGNVYGDRWFRVRGRRRRDKPIPPTIFPLCDLAAVSKTFNSRLFNLFDGCSIVYNENTLGCMNLTTTEMHTRVAHPEFKYLGNPMKIKWQKRVRCERL